MGTEDGGGFRIGNKKEKKKKKLYNNHKQQFILIYYKNISHVILILWVTMSTKFAGCDCGHQDPQI